MNRKLFLEKYSEEFANPRNMVSGLMNHKSPNDALKDCDYIRYGITNLVDLDMSKLEQLKLCNQLNKIQVPYKVLKVSEITTEIISNLFIEWSKEYEIDGIVIDVNDGILRNKLGRETSKPNPCYARAFKGNFEEVVETTVIDVIYQVSKNGKLAPVAKVKPVKCDGAVVSNITIYNAKTVSELGIGPGAIINIKRSGMVIPKIVDVLLSVNETLPTYCPECKKILSWNETGIDLICINPECPATKIAKLYAFFKIIDADNFSEGTIDTVVTAGYDTIKKILNLQVSDLIKLERIGKRKAEQIYKGIHSKLENIPLSKLQHASGFFQGLGSKKLLLVEKALSEFDFINYSNTPINELIKIEGFSKKSAEMYLNGIFLFNEWVKDIPCKIAKLQINEKIQPIGNLFKNEVIVFTGYRNPQAEERILLEGGEIGKKVNKKTTILVMKKKGSGTSKEQAAIELGIKILDKDEFEKLL